MSYLINNSYKRFLTFIVIIITAGLSACEKLIEIPGNPNAVSTERVYSDSTNVLGALVGIYAGYGAGTYVSGIHSGALSVYTGLSADEISYTSTNAAIDALSTNNVQLDNSIVNDFWTSGYTGIYQVNAFLAGVTGNSKISAAFQRQVRGEALITRALYYFNLVNLFGRVPLVTGTDYKVNAVAPRASVDDIYTQIVSDLTTATTLLTDKYPSAGRLRPNINAARALLSRVYLYRGQWKQASDMASLVINSGVYNVTQVAPGQVFLDGSREAIWQIPTLSPYSQTAEAGSFIPYASFLAPTYALTTYLKSAFEAGDKRLQMWTGTNTIGTISYVYPAKYKNLNNTDTPIEDYMIFRLGEQYLIRAEAFANQGLLDDARADINLIRTRAGLPAVTAASQADVLAAVAKERQTELFCEWGHRWFDLKRTGKAAIVLGAIKPGWTATDALYPVPLVQRNTNSFLDQNPGY